MLDPAGTTFSQNYSLECLPLFCWKWMEMTDVFDASHAIGFICLLSKLWVSVCNFIQSCAYTWIQFILNQQQRILRMVFVSGFFCGFWGLPPHWDGGSMGTARRLAAQSRSSLDQDFFSQSDLSLVMISQDFVGHNLWLPIYSLIASHSPISPWGWPLCWFGAAHPHRIGHQVRIGPVGISVSRSLPHDSWGEDCRNEDAQRGWAHGIPKCWEPARMLPFSCGHC